MITGFNTDVEYGGIVYHVQTEDKGLDTPLMLSLVYTHGEILASKRVRYDDLIASGFDEKILADRLLRQHKLICAAIRSGRLDDLKKMTERDVPVRPKPKKVPEPVAEAKVEEPVVVAKVVEPVVRAKVVEPVVRAKVVEPPPPAIPVPVIHYEKPIEKPVSPQKKEQRLPPRPHATSTSVLARGVQSPVQDSASVDLGVGAALRLVLVDEKNYKGGDRLTLRVRVEAGSDQRQTIPGADVIVKVLGSTFRPLIYQTRSGPDGIAAVRTELPHFRSGRAAILVRATAGGYEAELRRIIQQG